MGTTDLHQLYQYYRQQPIICTDTRKIEQGCIFFALKGDKFNANSFAEQAIASGAAFAVIDEEAYAKDERYLLVDDVLTALQALANHHRKQLQIPVIGITGTNGKTTTKELLHAVLSQKFKTFATAGNLNNHIGVPLSLLAIGDEIEVAIIEMGANHRGEIKFLSEIAEPTQGLITNVGKAHLEGFGSFEGVKVAKGELYAYLEAHQGKLYLQGDNEHLTEMLGNKHIQEITRYGFAEGNDIIGEVVEVAPFLTLRWNARNSEASNLVKTQLTGAYNAENVLAAVAVGTKLGLSDMQVNEGLAGYTPNNNRSQITASARNNTIIADYYNANASSMAAALDNMKVLNAERKVIILGDMFEMGEESSVEHQRVIAQALALKVEKTIFIGEAFYQHRSSEAIFYENTQQAVDHMQELNLKDSTILIKGSRGMKMESLLSSI